MSDTGGKQIRLVEYDPSWPAQLMAAVRLRC
jgi:hypothetical protein